MPTPETRQQLLTAVAACDDKKGEDTRILELDPADSGLADFFLITSASNDRQVVAIADEIEYRLKKEHGLYASSVEGRRQAEWILLDYVDLVIHVFLQEKRAFYDIERLRKSARNLTGPEVEKDIASDLKAALAKKTLAARKHSSSTAKSSQSSSAAPKAPSSASSSSSNPKSLKGDSSVSAKSAKKAPAKAAAKKAAPKPAAKKTSAKKAPAKKAVAKKAPAKKAVAKKAAAKKAPAKKAAAKKAPAKKTPAKKAPAKKTAAKSAAPAPKKATTPAKKAAAPRKSPAPKKAKTTPAESLPPESTTPTTAPESTEGVLGEIHFGARPPVDK